jgi:hypothetical protein
MQFPQRFRSKAALGSGLLVVLAAFVLSSCGGAATGAPTIHHHVIPIATEGIPPTSVCGNGGDYVTQSLNGDFTGCFRVPALASSSLVVALQAYLNGATPPSNVTTTTVGTPLSKNGLSLTLSAHNVVPGEIVKIIGHLSKKPPSPRQTFVNICWDGCLTGLQEGGFELKWTSPTTFQTKLQVPETAWLESNHGIVSVHPLSSGNYQVGVQCLGVISGCAFTHADAEATVTLKAPVPKRCVKGQPCETLKLSTTSTKVGDIVSIKGWAPLQTVIGRPFGWQYSVTTGSIKPNFPALTYDSNQKGGGFNVVLTPRALHVAPSTTWASLGRIPYLSSTFGGPSAISPSSNSSQIAWCQTSGLQITKGPSQLDIPTSDVATALRGTPLSLFSSPAADPPCATVLLDPTHHGSLYAGFDTAVQHNAPPIYNAGLYKTNDGATWRTVPTPAGDTVENFSGFETEGSRVAALFAGENTYNSRGAAPGTSHGLVSAEVTSDGGKTWTSTTLGCPSSGPCTTFGPYQWGNCAMNGSPQPLLQGPTGSTAASGVRWTDTAWSSTINSCFFPQLVVSSAHNELLLDTTSQYPLQESKNAGRTWSYVALPHIPGAGYNGDGTSLGNTLLFTPDGSLLAVVQPVNSQREKLFRLYPGATSWCQAPNVFPGTYSDASIGPLRIAGTQLLWSESIYPNGAANKSVRHEVPLSSLHC